MNRLRVAAATLAAALVAALAPAAGATTTNFSPETGFGGYRTSRVVIEIAARWKVPAIRADSAANSLAATWIGAQSPFGPPFIQLGTTEAVSAKRVASYALFWSDAAVGFHPKLIGKAKPGDEIVASMRQVASGWRLQLLDATAHHRVTRTVAYTTGAQFTQGEWLQEDPTAKEVSATDLAYPRLGTVHFSDLRLDGEVPSLTLENGETLTTSDDRFFVPSSVRDNAFSLEPATGAARVYLVGAARLDVAIARLDAAVAEWSKTPAPRRTAVARQLAAAYTTFDHWLAGHRWPVAARGPVRTLAANIARLASATRRWLAEGLRRNGAGYQEMMRDQAPQLTDAARASLGLPPA